MARIASEVAAQRARRRWSQERLAVESGVSRYTVSRLETGGTWPDILALFDICEALDLEIDVSLRRTPPADPS